MTARGSRRPAARWALAALLALSSAGVVGAQDMTAEFPIRGEDGSPVANHTLAPDLAARVEALPSKVVIGNPSGDLTLIEFYDLNCPYCRKAASDIAELLKADQKLRVVLVPYPVLGIASIQAGRVDFALAKLVTPRQFHDFHRAIFSGRGVVDGNRALEVAKSLGFAAERILAIANDDAITEAMKAHARLGDTLGMRATPSFVVKGVAIVGYPGRAALEALLKAARQCGKLVCG
jgi:protein-disulfide isomerase